MNLYVRHKEKGVWINFIHDITEFKDFEASYISGRNLLIGDISSFTRPMLNRLLKFIEENPEVNCYTSKDITDPILLSRFVSIIKEPITISSITSINDFMESNKDYVAAVSFLGNMSTDLQLRVPLVNSSMLKLIEKL